MSKAAAYLKVPQEPQEPQELQEAIALETLRSRDSAANDGIDSDGDGEHSYQSDSSETSQIFADISDYSRSATGEQTFEEDAVFYQKWTHFMKGASSGKTHMVLMALFCILLWMIFLVVYSSGNAQKQAATLWHGSDTNIVALSEQRNISLNSFDPNKKNVTFAAYRKGSFMPTFSPIRWLTPAQFPQSKDTEAKGYYATRKDKKLVVLLADSTYEKVILDSTQFSYGNKFYYAQDVILNPGQPIDNLSAIHLLRSDLVLQWRHSSFSLFWLWKPITGEVFPIQASVLQKEPKLLEKLHFAKFDPLGKHVVFGFERNLYLIDVQTHQVTQLTDNGSPDIFNGKPDWVYEEEVYPHDNLVWWSPDLKYLVYSEINDTEVASYDMDYYVKESGEVAMTYEDIHADGKDTDINQYPKHTSVKYPKPGTPNPKMKMFCYNVELQQSVEITGLSDEIVGEEFLLYDASWIDSNDMLLKISDRHSSVLEKKVLRPSESFKAAFVSIQNASDYGGWIEKAPPIALVRRGSTVSYLDRIVVDDIVQLALFDTASSNKYSQLLGPVNYESVLSYDKLENCVYGMFGTNLKSSLARVSLENGEKTILAKSGEYGLNFSPNSQFLELIYAGPDQPSQKLINLALVAGTENFIDRVESIDDSSRLSAVLADTNMPTRIRTTVKVGRDAENVNIIEIFPPNFNKKQKHPLLVHVYGGPGSTTVNRAFGVDFQDIVSAQLNAVVLIIDPRGTGSDDWKHKAHLKGKMGFWEPRDVMSIAKDYIKANAYIDGDKTAVWGWSYGGFTTLKTLEIDKGEVFKYGMAVAPVTNWLFYDSVFTERIMGSPKENPGYQAISRINDFDNFKAVKRFLIMQGTADDNVHIQNSLWLMDNFDKHSVENYDVHFFPDSDHAIYYHNANTIVYDKLFWWLRKAYSGYFD